MPDAKNLQTKRESHKRPVLGDDCETQLQAQRAEPEKLANTSPSTSHRRRRGMGVGASGHSRRKCASRNRSNICVDLLGGIFLRAANPTPPRPTGPRRPVRPWRFLFAPACWSPRCKSCVRLVKVGRMPNAKVKATNLVFGCLYRYVAG